jgi:ribosomal protein S3
MPNGRELQNVTPPSGNGHDQGIDPKIVKMAEFLDRAIRTQNTTVGIVTAAIGIVLGRKGENPETLERMISDVNSAMRVGFYLHYIKGK